MYKIIGGDGSEYGPVSPEQLRQWVTEGRANGQTQVKAEGTEDWKPLSDVPELATALIASPAGGPPPMRPPAPAAVTVPNYLVQAILVTVCCCVPLGIPAIIFAAQVNSKFAIGDVAGAQESSRKAKMWCWIALGAGLLAGLFYFLFYGAMFMAEFRKMR